MMYYRTKAKPEFFVGKNELLDWRPEEYIEFVTALFNKMIEKEFQAGEILFDEKVNVKYRKSTSVLATGGCRSRRFNTEKNSWVPEKLRVCYSTVHLSYCRGRGRYEYYPTLKQISIDNWHVDSKFNSYYAMLHSVIVHELAHCYHYHIGFRKSDTGHKGNYRKAYRLLLQKMNYQAIFGVYFHLKLKG